MARRAIKEINWAAFAERVPDSEKQVFGAFKARAELYLRRMNAYPEAAPKIDWEYYKKNISKPGLVDNFKKQYEALSIPYPEDKYTATFEKAKQKKIENVKQFHAEADEKIAMIKSNIEQLRRTLPLEEMTIEEFYEACPSEAYNIDKPTAWPHTEDAQPENEPPREHH